MTWSRSCTWEFKKRALKSANSGIKCRTRSCRCRVSLMLIDCALFKHLSNRQAILSLWKRRTKNNQDPGKTVYSSSVPGRKKSNITDCFQLWVMKNGKQQRRMPRDIRQRSKVCCQINQLANSSLTALTQTPSVQAFSKTLPAQDKIYFIQNLEGKKTTRMLATQMRYTAS